MLQKKFLMLLISIFGLNVLAACGGQVATRPATEVSTTLPATATVSVPTAKSTVEPPVTPFIAEGLTQPETVTAEPGNQSADTLVPVEESTPPTSEIACNGTLTPVQAEGPFYTPNTPQKSNLVEPEMGGIPLLLTGLVLNQNCEPVVGAMLDFWQTDENGAYDNVGYRMRGHQFTDENGNYALETVLPGEYPGRTPHIHVKVFSPDGQTEWLTSQVYFAGISDQIADGIFRPDLLATNLQPEANGRQHVAFNFVVQN